MNEKIDSQIGMLGGGGQADEAESYLLDAQVAFRALNTEYVNRNDPNQIDIVQPDEYQRMLPVVAAVGAPALRKQLVEQWPGEHYATIVSNEAYVDKSVEVGEGSIVAPRAVITTNTKIGRHSIVNILASISHNCVLGDFTTISPGAHIAGNVTLGDGVFVGIGAIVSNNVRIAEGVVIGAGAVVLHDIEIPNSIYVGNPARLLRQNEGWLDAI